MVKTLTNKQVFVLVILVLLLAGCSGQEEVPTATAVPTKTTRPVAVTTSTPQPTDAPTLTPEPTPLVPAIVVSDQVLTETGVVIADHVNSSGAGWLVIHNLNDGIAGEVLGYAAVPPGGTDSAEVTIDAMKAGSDLLAMLHVDAGTAGDYEFPGLDGPMEADGEPVTSIFMVDRQFPLPSITVPYQTITEEGLITITEVFIPVNGWLLLHADDNGEVGEIVGRHYLEAGINRDLVVAVPWRNIPSTLHAILYEDHGRPKRLDDVEEDIPFLVDDAPLATVFDIGFPIDIHVLDQPLVNGEIVVDRVTMDQPGWLVVYTEDNGEFGLIIGAAPLEEGLNENVRVEVTENTADGPLLIMLHEDTEPDNAFSYPGEDGWLTIDDLAFDPVPMNPIPGNYLITEDQPSRPDGTALVPLVVSDLETWLVIYTDDNGELGEIISFTNLPAGVNRNVEVEVDPDEFDAYFAVLHLDLPEAGEFEYPDGSDTPLVRNQEIIRSPFKLIPAE